MSAHELSRYFLENCNGFYQDLFGKLFLALHECNRLSESPNWKQAALRVKKLLKTGRTTDQIITAIYGYRGALKRGTSIYITVKLDKYIALFADAIRAMDEGSLEEIRTIANASDLKRWKPF